MIKTTVTKRSWKTKEVTKYTLVRVLQLFTRIFHIFPIKKNRVVFHSFKGKQYSCNPKAITEYLLKHYPGKYEIVWLLRNPARFKSLEKNGIKLVQYISLKRVFLESTATVCVNNFGSFNWIPVRKNQLHINTWHGGGCYKKIQTDELSDKTRTETSRQTTHMVSSSRFFSEYVVRGEFQFRNNLLEIGMPRNDVFFDDHKVNRYNRRVRNKYGIKEDNSVILYAPTWRFESDVPMPDFERMKDAVEKLTGRQPVLITRVHHYLAQTYEGSIDATSYPDMQDLLCSADVLITDYSSSIWDYSYLYRPCFLYAPDVEDYIHDRGFDRDIYTWGFPVCKSDDELYDAIINFDPVDFRKKMEKHHKDLGSFEDGHATEKICKVITQHMDGLGK